MDTCDTLHIIEENSNWDTQSHVEQDFFVANFFIIFILHEDGQEVVGRPGHFLSLRGHHTDALHVAANVILEAELFFLGRRSVIISTRLGNDEGVKLQGLFCDEYFDVPFAVVADVTRSDISHCFMSGVTEWSGLQVLLDTW